MAVAIEFGSQGQATSTSSVATIAGLDFNAEASDRIIAVTIAAEDANDTFTGVTIGGVTASVLVDATGGLRRCAIWAAEVPTGTSGDVVVTLTPGDTNVSASTFSVTGSELPETDTDQVVSTTSVTTLSITALTVDTDGAGLVAYCNGSDGTAVTWTGATEAHDTDPGAFRHSAAIVTDVGTNTISAEAASNPQALVGVAFGPASGGGETTETRTLSISGVATPTFLAELLSEATVSAAGGATVSPVAEQILESTLAAAGSATVSPGSEQVVTATFASNGSASTSFLNATEGQEPAPEPEPEETPNGVSGGTYKKPKKKKRKRALEYDDGGFGGVLAPMEEGGAVVPVPEIPVADDVPADVVQPGWITRPIAPVATLADRLGNIDYAAERAARAKRLEEIADEDFLLLMAA